MSETEPSPTASLSSIGALFSSAKNLANTEDSAKREKYVPAVQSALKNLTLSQNTLDRSESDEAEMTAYLEDYEERLQDGTLTILLELMSCASFKQ
jgi:hypothetical protein